MVRMEGLEPSRA